MSSFVLMEYDLIAYGGVPSTPPINIAEITVNMMLEEAIRLS